MIATIAAIVIAAVLITFMCWACAHRSVGREEISPPWVEPERVYGLKELEPICGVSRKTLKRYIDAGRLKAEKIDGKWEIKERDLNAFLDWREGK